MTVQRLTRFTCDRCKATQDCPGAERTTPPEGWRAVDVPYVQEDILLCDPCLASHGDLWTVHTKAWEEWWEQTDRLAALRASAMEAYKR